MELNRFIDHTVLKATTSVEEIKKLCSEAKEFNFYSVCVNGCYVPLAKKELENSKVKIAAVIGFPLGAMSKEAKINIHTYLKYDLKIILKNSPTLQ